MRTTDVYLLAIRKILSIIQIVKYTAYPLKFIIHGNVNENIKYGYNSAFKFLKIIFKKV